MIWQFTLTNPIEGSLILSDEPLGWSDIVFNLKRDMNWHGIFFEFAINLKYYGEGYTYTKNIYETQGVNAFVSLLIEMKCDDTEAFRTFYDGKLVMSLSVFDCSDVCFAEIPIEQAGCLMTFKNRNDQHVDLNANLDFSGNDLPPYSKLPFNISLPSRTLVFQTKTDYCCELDTSNSQFNIGGIERQVHVLSGTGCQDAAEDVYMNFPLDCKVLDELSVGIPQTMEWTWDSSSGAHVMWVVPYTGLYDLTFSVVCTPMMETPRNVNQVRVELWDGLTNLIATSWNSGFTSGGHRFFNVNETLHYVGPLSGTDNIKILLHFYWSDCFNRDLTNDYYVYQSYIIDLSQTYCTQLIIKGIVEAEPTSCYVFMINEALARVIEAITDNCMTVKSDYYGRTDSEPYTSSVDGCGSLRVITKGLLIREFPIANDLMVVSFQEMFNALNAIDNIGIGTEFDSDKGSGQRIRVEPMQFFYDPSDTVLFCDNVPEIVKRVKTDMFPSTIDIGYGKWETENEMGLDEINTRRTFRTSMVEITKNIQLYCSFISSGYSIEVTRNKEYVADSTTDWRYDNDTFIICLKRDGGLSVEQGIDCADTGAMTGVLNPDSMYNYRITPYRNLMRWFKAILATYFYDIDSADSKLIFTKGDGNYVANGKLITGCILENGAVGENQTMNTSIFTNSVDKTPVFRFELIEFDYPLSVDDYVTFLNDDTAKYKLIGYRKLSTDPWQYGYIYTIQYKPNDGIASFVLLPRYSSR